MYLGDGGQRPRLLERDSPKLDQKTVTKRERKRPRSTKDKALDSGCPFPNTRPLV